MNKPSNIHDNNHTKISSPTPGNLNLSPILSLNRKLQYYNNRNITNINTNMTNDNKLRIFSSSSSFRSLTPTCHKNNSSYISNNLQNLNNIKK
jgi:hypothetical protein